MRFQPIYDIAELCALKGIENAVLSPGSRCAPLTLAFARHQKITTRTFADERSAGFIALGLSQSTSKPVVVVCTSGSAAYNLAPAVAEAFFNETPLVIFTADRPMEWIAQHDGQTIYQPEIFGKHVKKSFQLPQDYDHDDSTWAINRIVNEAINLSQEYPQGPVHINAPFREPLYPAKGESIEFSTEMRTIVLNEPMRTLSSEQRSLVENTFRQSSRTLIVVGQQSETEVMGSLQQLSKAHSLPVVGDIISNAHSVEDLVRHADLFLGQAPDSIKKTLQPDLLITFGRSLVSKNVKLFLRKFKPKYHWHVQAAGNIADPFKTITHVFRTDVKNFLDLLSSRPKRDEFDAQKQENFRNLWRIEDRRAERVVSNFFNDGPVSELELVADVLHAMPENASLHLANSMSVRYANFIGLTGEKSGVTAFSNRGTSGIDGCTSTAVGHSLGSKKPTVLITGDLAFFYDRNAFWHNYPIENLRVVVLNNHGGLIFGILDGPRSLAEADEFFITRQKLSAEHLCREFGFDHLKLDNRRKLKNTLKEFFEFDGRTKILELESDIELNRTIFDNLKHAVSKTYES